MILSHDKKKPRIDSDSYVVPTAVVCGDVRVASGFRIMFGAGVISEGKPIASGSNCIIMENAVLRSTEEHELTIDSHCLIGPHAHVVGCAAEDVVFIATGRICLSWRSPPRGS